MSEKKWVWSWHLSLALVMVVAMILFTFVYLRSFGELENAASKASDAFHPKEFVNTIITGTINDVKSKPKLVVLTAEVGVTLEKKSSKQYFFNLGTSTIELRFGGNKVQYIIPTDQLTAKLFKWDEKHNELVLDIPEPHIDKDIVEVQSDPSKIRIRKDVGWFRFDDFNGEKLLELTKKDMRKAVIKAGQNELLQYKAKSEAKKIIRKLFIDRMRKQMPKNHKLIIIN